MFRLFLCLLTPISRIFSKLLWGYWDNSVGLCCSITIFSVVYSITIGIHKHTLYKYWRLLSLTPYLVCALNCFSRVQLFGWKQCLFLFFLLRNKTFTERITHILMFKWGFILIISIWKRDKPTPERNIWVSWFLMTILIREVGRIEKSEFQWFFI